MTIWLPRLPPLIWMLLVEAVLWGSCISGCWLLQGVVRHREDSLWTGKLTLLLFKVCVGEDSSNLILFLWDLSMEHLIQSVSFAWKWNLKSASSCYRALYHSCLHNRQNFNRLSVSFPCLTMSKTLTCNFCLSCCWERLFERLQNNVVIILSLYFVHFLPIGIWLLKLLLSTFRALPSFNSYLAKETSAGVAWFFHYLAHYSN